MKRWLSIIAAAGLLLYPFAAFAADYGSQLPQTQQGPPVAQALVREGDFAIKLAAQLNLGNPTDEAVAEDILATAGVVPLNGWLSDYPMTPQIVGQLQESIAKAAADGKLPMNSEEATRGLNNLVAQMELPTPASPGSAPAQGQGGPAEQSNPSVINNYYYNEGPPVVTYYPPPPDYAYMYNWVPYPSWWFGFWFPGFFICHNFTTVVVSGGVVVNGGVVVVPRHNIVSNRIIDPVTRRVAFVDPVTRTGAGRVSVTTIRTGNGRTFNTLSDLRRNPGVSGPRTMMPTNSPNSTIRTREGFASSDARRGAERIYSRSVENMLRFRGYGMRRGEAGRYVAPAAPTRSYRGPVRSEERRFDSSGPSIRYNAPLGGGGQPFIAPSVPDRSYRTPMMRDGGGSPRSFISSGVAPTRMPSRTFYAPTSMGGGNAWSSYSGSGRSVRSGGQGFVRGF